MDVPCVRGQELLSPGVRIEFDGHQLNLFLIVDVRQPIQERPIAHRLQDIAFGGDAEQQVEELAHEAKRHHLQPAERQQLGQKFAQNT